MLEILNSIGGVLKSMDRSRDIADLVLIDYRPPEHHCVIDIEGGRVSSRFVAPQKDAYRGALYYAKARAFAGGAIKSEKPENLPAVLNFMEIRREETRQKVEEEVKKILRLGIPCLIELRIDGKSARELFRAKFIEETILKTRFKRDSAVHACHLCGKRGRNYNTATYAFYNNDKDIFGCTGGLPFNICRECLENVLLANEFAKRFLTAYWADTSVMFLPTRFSREIRSAYEGAAAAPEKGAPALGPGPLLCGINADEKSVFRRIAQTNTITDIVFYEENKSEWKIRYCIRGVMPGRFVTVAQQLEKCGEGRGASLREVCQWFNVQEGARHRLYDAIFHGTPLSRQLFFRQAVNALERKYFDERYRNKYNILWKICKAYNFLCGCGCLQGGWEQLTPEGARVLYGGEDDCIHENPALFGSGEKKAWFLLGAVMDKLRRPGEELPEPLPNGKFDARGFFELLRQANRLANLFVQDQGGTQGRLLQQKLRGARAAYGETGGSLDVDEAKFLYHWGKDFESESGRAEYEPDEPAARRNSDGKNERIPYVVGLHHVESERRYAAQQQPPAG